MMIRKNNTKDDTGRSMLRSGKLMLLLGIALTLSTGIFAQVGSDGEVDPDAPFDGGISLLVAAGVAYGAKQRKESRKSNKTDESNGELVK